MKSNQDQQTTAPAKFRVGDHVRLQYPGGLVEAVITEDRGPIGVRGRRLMRVEILDEEVPGRVLELPEEELVPA